ncbi:hypothetical protein [Spirosoma arcticum]
MEQDNQANEVHALSDVDRFYILMEPLHGVVETQNSIELGQCSTPDELRQAIISRAAKVKAILRKN